MEVTCLLGMSIPAGPDPKHNPVLSVKRPTYAWLWAKVVQERLALLGGTAEAAVPTWLTFLTWLT